MKKILLFALLPLLFSCATQEKVGSVALIAHAGGAIDGHVHTNSREALEQAVSDGYTYIEFDLLLTSDSVLVAARSWEEFNRITGHEEKGDSAPSFAEFTSRLIHGKYTPLSADEINGYFMSTPGICLVTDKISAPELLAKYFPALKKRMVVEAFSYEHYNRLVEEGYFRVLYSCMASDLGSAVVKNLLFDRIFPGRRIEWIALHTSAADNALFRLLNSTRKFNIALFTVDDYGEMHRTFHNRVKMIYTNSIKP